MSLKAIIQIVVYLQSFSNIDLYDKGIYVIKARISQNTSNQVQINAYPYRIINIKTQQQYKNKITIPCSIYDKIYNSNSFMVKYIDQQINIEECVIFKLQVDAYPLVNTQNIILYFDLYYSEDLQCKYQNLKFGSVLSVRLNNLQRGIGNYGKFNFGQNYKSCLNIYVFSILMEYKFRLNNSINVINNKKKVIGFIKQIRNIQDFYENYYKQKNNDENSFYHDYVKKFRYLSQYIRYELNNLIIGVQEIKKYKICKSAQIKQLLNESKYQEIEVNQQKFQEYLSIGYKIKKLTFQFIKQQLHNIYIQNFLFFQKFLKQLQSLNIKKQLLKQQNNRILKKNYQNYIFKTILQQSQLQLEQYGGKQKKYIANHFRTKYNLNKTKSNLQFITSRQIPILFHQIIYHSSQNQSILTYIQKNKNVLFVLQHGFQGNSLDMIFIKNTLKQFYPDAFYLIIQSNSGQTDGDIKLMGARLAQQLKQYIQDQNIQQNLIIHMIGHSMGGLILRASLPYLQKYSFGVFISLSVPHLGYLNGTKASIGAGLWIIKKWNHILSLQQLALSDNSNLKQTTLYELSEIGSLKCFKQVVLVTSFDDPYVPWHSGRIQNYNSHFQKMIQNIFGNKNNSRIKKIHRIDISFQKFQRNLDSIIGRTAHIRFLVDQKLMQILLYCIDDIIKQKSDN